MTMSSCALDWAKQPAHTGIDNSWVPVTGTSVLQTPKLVLQVYQQTPMGVMPVTGNLRVQFSFAGKTKQQKYQATQVMPLGTQCVLESQNLIVDDQPHVGVLIQLDVEGQKPELVKKLNDEFAPPNLVEFAMFPLKVHQLFEDGQYTSKPQLSNSNTSLTLKITCTDASLSPYTQGVIQQISDKQIDLEHVSALWDACNNIRDTTKLSMMNEETQRVLQQMPMRLPNAHSPLQTNNTPEQIEMILTTMTRFMPEYWLHPMLTTMIQYYPEWKHSNKPMDVKCEEILTALNYNQAGKNMYTFDTNFETGVELKSSSKSPDTMLARWSLIRGTAGEQHQVYGLPTKSTIEINNRHMQKLRMNPPVTTMDQKVISQNVLTDKLNVGISISCGAEQPRDCEDGAYGHALSTNTAMVYAEQDKQWRAVTQTNCGLTQTNCDGAMPPLFTHLKVALSTGLYVSNPSDEFVRDLSEMIVKTGEAASKKNYKFACGLAAAPNMQTPAKSFKLPSGLSAQDTTNTLVNSLGNGILGGHAYVTKSNKTEEVAKNVSELPSDVSTQLHQIIPRCNLGQDIQIPSHMTTRLRKHDEILVVEPTSSVQRIKIDQKINQALQEPVSFSLSMKLNSGEMKPVTSMQNVTQTRLSADTLLPAYQANFIETNYGHTAVGIPLNKVPDGSVENWAPTFVQGHFALDGIPVACDANKPMTIKNCYALPSEKGFVEGTVKVGTFLSDPWPVEQKIVNILTNSFVPGAFPGLEEQTRYLSTLGCQLTPPQEWRTELPMFSDLALVKVRRLTPLGSCEKNELTQQQKLAAMVGAQRFCDDTVLSFTLGFPRTKVT